MSASGESIESIADLFEGLTYRQARALRQRILPTLQALRQAVIEELPAPATVDELQQQVRADPPSPPKGD